MKLIVTILLSFLTVLSFGQDKPQKVNIDHADELEGGVYQGKNVRKLRGAVVFSQDNVKMFCDSAYQYVNTNTIDAFGRVKIKQSDGMTIEGDFLTYEGNSKTAKMRKNVVMKDKTMTLYTDYLDYDMKSKTGYYYEGGKIIDKQMTLTSEKGKYHSPSKTLFFKDSVHLVNTDYEVWCDTLNYNTSTKNAYFLGPTNIVSKGTKLFANKGMYNSYTGISHFERRASINDTSYTLTGDSIHYDRKTQVGYAHGNVELYLKKDSIIIYGETGISDDSSGISKIYGPGTLMKSLMEKDTVYLKADTLLAIKDSADNVKSLTAWHNVEMFKSDLQVSCDSLAYNYVDSTISLYTAPVLWSGESQMTGQFIKIFLDKGQVDKMNIDEDAFIISEDDFKNYNQIKGKDMIVFFQEGKIKNLDVKGNGQSVYYVLEGDSILTGLNKSLCTDMKFLFDSNEVKTIKFITSPEAQFIPPARIKQPDRFLPGYAWLIDKKPILSEMLSLTKPSEHSFLKVPEEAKLPKNSSKNQEQNLVNREDD